MSAETRLDRVLALAAIPELADLHPDDLASLAEQAEEQTVSADDACAVRLLLSGRVEAGPSRTPIAAPAMIGAVEALAGVAFPVRAVSDAWVLAIERPALLWVMSDVFETMLAMLRHTAARWLLAEDLEAEPVTREGSAPPLDRPVSLAHRILLLSGCEIFRSLRVHGLGRVASEMEELELPAQSILWEPGARASHCFAVIDGSVEIGAEPFRSAPLLQRPGAVLGLRRVISGGERNTRAVSTTPVRVLRLAGESLVDELEDDPEMAAAFLESLAHQTLRAESANPKQPEPRP